MNSFYYESSETNLWLEMRSETNEGEPRGAEAKTWFFFSLIFSISKNAPIFSRRISMKCARNVYPKFPNNFPVKLHFTLLFCISVWISAWFWPGDKGWKIRITILTIRSESFLSFFFFFFSIRSQWFIVATLYNIVYYYYRHLYIFTGIIAVVGAETRRRPK